MFELFKRQCKCGHEWCYAGPIRGTNWRYRWRCLSCSATIVRNHGELDADVWAVIRKLDDSPSRDKVNERLAVLECGMKGHKMKLENISKEDTRWQCSECGFKESVTIENMTPSQVKCCVVIHRSIKKAKEATND